MKKITLLFFLLFLNNKKSATIEECSLVNNNQQDLILIKKDLADKINALKQKIISEEQNKENEICKFKNKNALIEEELKNINLEVMNTEIALLNTTFTKEMDAFQKRNAYFECEIKSLQDVYNEYSKKIHKQKEKLSMLSNKIIEVNSINHCSDK